MMVGPGRTGGPHAMHQLADALMEMGHDVGIFYTLESARGLTWAGGEHANNYVLEHPNLNVIDESFFSQDAVIFLPEVWAHWALDLAVNHRVIVWWLSVDYGLLAIGRKRCFLDHYRTHPSIFNAYQSSYAKAFLDALGLNPFNLSLSDYTTVNLALGPKASHERSPTPKICFNPMKGAWLSNYFMEAHKDITCIPIAGLNSAELIQVFKTSHFYIDFGSLPGKDRLPREALAAGARIFLHTAGDGSFEQDWRLPAHAYFTAADCISGDLYKRIKTHLNDTNEPEWQAAREAVALEQKNFKRECQELVKTLELQADQKGTNEIISRRINSFYRFEDELTRAERRIHAVENSSSWKLTAPIRKLLARISGVETDLVR
jgi:hypothetical protein